MADSDFIFAERQRAFLESERLNTILRGDLAALFEEREYLLRIAMPAIQTNYLIKIGALQVELRQQQMEITRARRKLDLLRAASEEGAVADCKQVEAQVRREFQGWVKRLENDHSGIEEAKARFSSLIELEDEPQSRRLYTLLAAKLCPEIHPGQSAEAKAFWPQVRLAYSQGDLFQLKALWIMSLDYPDSYYLPSHLGEIRASCDRLEEKITESHTALQMMREHPCFEWKKLLESPEALAQEQARLREQIAQAKQEKQALLELLSSIQLSDCALN